MSVFGVFETTTNATTYLSTCDIEFVNPGLIDIKQLSFAIVWVKAADHHGASGITLSSATGVNFATQNVS
jgi:proteasome lid subunit RPN8/RPN11